MIRKIIHIDPDKCTGCGLCADACHEGAIGMVDGKARLLREDFCDGLGDCLPACPADAISFEEREAPAYDHKAVLEARAEQTRIIGGAPLPSYLKNWPVQIKLAPVRAPYFQGADLLVAADCTAYAYGNFHRDFMAGHVTLVGCPKLDGVDYSEKLTAILTENEIRSVTLARMEVPCCGGLELALKRALERCGKEIPLFVTVLSIKGEIL